MADNLKSIILTGNLESSQHKRERFKLIDLSNILKFGNQSVCSYKNI